MRNKKVYYWIKLKKDFYDNDKIDFLMSQDNGCAYVVIYQMLLLKVINSNGILATSLNDVLVPFDINKIKRECKYFDIDTIQMAIALFIKLELIYQAKVLNNSYVIANYNENIGHETNLSIAKAKERENKRLINAFNGLEYEKNVNELLASNSENVRYYLNSLEYIRQNYIYQENTDNFVQVKYDQENDFYEFLDSLDITKDKKTKLYNLLDSYIADLLIKTDKINILCYLWYLDSNNKIFNKK